MRKDGNAVYARPARREGGRSTRGEPPFAAQELAELAVPGEPPKP